MSPSIIECSKGLLYKMFVDIEQIMQILHLNYLPNRFSTYAFSMVYYFPAMAVNLYGGYSLLNVNHFFHLS